MSGDFYLLGVSASSGLPSSLLSEPEVADSPILCLTTAKLSAFAGLHNIPLHSQKRSWYQRLLMHVGGGRRPICLQRRAPIVSRALPSAGMPPRRSRPGNCRIRKARGGWWGMVAASSVRPLAFSRAPKTVQGRRTPLTLLHSGVKPAWIPLPWSLYTFAHHHLAQNMIHSKWLLRTSQIIKRRQNVLNITEDLDMCWELLSDFDKIPRCLKANVNPAMPF